VCCFDSISFWYGAKLIRENKLEITDLFVAFFSVLIGGMYISDDAKRVRDSGDIGTSY
jgi:hypothetical protein